MVEPLVIPFVVVVRDALADGATPRALADQHQALEAGFLDGAHEALRVGVQVRRAGIVRLIRLDPKHLPSRTIRLQGDATRPGRRLGRV